MKRIHLSGVPFDACTMEEALALADRALTEGGYPGLPVEETTVSPLTVVTPNAVIAGKSLADPSLCRLLDRATLCLPDGAGAVLGARLAGRTEHRKQKKMERVTGNAMPPPEAVSLPERVAGIDFGKGVLRLAANRGESVYLLGGKPGVAEQAARRLTAELPSLSVAGTHDGYFAESETERVLANIRASGAAVLVVCLGFPRQERFLLDHAKDLPSVKIAMGLGGSLDVWAGNLRRAPGWVQKAKLEWLWRCVGEPRRLGDLRFALRFLAAARRGEIRG